nr:hypothetical protein Iba_chr15dCG5990 [Ipomoea batatas]
MNQLFICFSCNPVSSTSFALSSSFGYGHLECCCHQFLRTVVVSPGNFPALLFLNISSLTSSILDLNPCMHKHTHSCRTLSIRDLSDSVGSNGPNPIKSCPPSPPAD